MANYIVYAKEPNVMRADRRNAIFVTAASAEAARTVAAALVGPAVGALAGFEVLDLASAPDFIVRGHQPTIGVTGDVL